MVGARSPAPTFEGRAGARPRAWSSNSATSRRDDPITRIFSSPFVRCTETVEPLARKLKLEVEPSDALAEGARLADALRLVEKHVDANAVLCMHGDVLPELLNFYAGTGVRASARPRREGLYLGARLVDGIVDRIRYFAPKS